MTYQTTLRSAVCFAALVAGGAAQADVTAAEVWADWREMKSEAFEDKWPRVETILAEFKSG